MFKKIIKLLLIVLVISIISFAIFLNQNYSVPILMYHSLDKARVDTYSALDPEVFRQQMKFIYDHKYKVIALEQYLQALKDDKPINKDWVIITFDDGFKDNLELLPILKDYPLPVTIFLVVDNINKDEYLSSQEINTLLNSIPLTLGSHTYTHAYLPDTSLSDLKREIFDSKKKLEQLFGREIKTICYPSGGFDKRVLKEVEAAGYLGGLTTNRGFSKKIDRFALRRIKVTNKDSNLSLWFKLSGFYNIFKNPKKPY